MEITRNVDISSVRVEVWAAHRHSWGAGQKHYHDPSVHHTPSLQCQLWLIQQGAVEVQSKNQNWIIESGEAFCLPVSLEREISTPQPATWLSLRLWVTVFNQFNLMQNVVLPARWRPEEIERHHLESWMQLVESEHKRESAHHLLMISGLAQAIFGLCWPHLSSSSLVASIHSELPQWLGQTLHRIGENLHWNVADFAREAGFSPAQFRRAFHQHIGSTPQNYLKTQRLEAARHFLEYTELPIKVISQRLGLNDVDHFSQVFKTAYGLSPAHYRASLHAD